VGALKTAIDHAEHAKVNQKIIRRGKKYLEYMEYIKEFEGFI
jgi:hypothetical protein